MQEHAFTTLTTPADSVTRTAAIFLFFFFFPPFISFFFCFPIPCGLIKTQQRLRSLVLCLWINFK